MAHDFRTPLSVGVASIETCISGNFFKGYPMVNFLTGPVECKKGDTYIKQLIEGQHYIHIDDEKSMVWGHSFCCVYFLQTSVTVNVDKRHKHLNITGFNFTQNSPKSVTISLKQTRRKRRTNTTCTRPTTRTSTLAVTAENTDEVTIDVPTITVVDPNVDTPVVSPAPSAPSSISNSTLLDAREKKEKRKRERPGLHLELDANWKPVADTEAILFVHGFYHNLEDSLKRYISTRNLHPCLFFKIRTIFGARTFSSVHQTVRV